MAVVKITELLEASSAQPNDVFPFVGVNTGVTYKITAEKLAQSLPLFPYTGSASISGSATIIGPVVIRTDADVNDTLLRLKDSNEVSKFLFNVDTSGFSRLGIGVTPDVSLDVSGSAKIRQGLSVSGSITVSDTITAQKLVVQTVTSSIIYSSGSNIFGNKSTDKQIMTGSLLVSGSATFVGTVNGTFSGGVTGNAATATALQNARTINGVSFDGTANILVNTNNAVTFNNGGSGAASGTTFDGSAARTISYNTIGAQPQLNGTGFVKISGTTISYDNSTYQPQLNGTGFIKASGTTISYDNSTYLTSAVQTISFGTTGLTPSTATAGAVTVGGTLAVANGGTGATNATSARTNLDAAKTDQIMYIGSTSVAINRASANLALTGITSIDGNAATVTNGVYTNGTYSNPAWITSLAGSKISGNISGNASNITSYTINQDLGTGNNVTHNQVISNTDCRAPIFFDSLAPTYFLDLSALPTSLFSIGDAYGRDSYYNIFYDYNNTNCFLDLNQQSYFNRATGYNIRIDNGSASGQYAIMYLNRVYDGAALEFYLNETFTGAINIQSGNTTQYATSSDYRLKENIEDLTGGIEKIMKMRPRKFRWKSSGDEGIGFVAHELQEVAPEAVSGKKDAINAEGEPSYQGVDQSKLVATLIAAFQEQQNEIQKLKLEIELLKNK